MICLGLVLLAAFSTLFGKSHRSRAELSIDNLAEVQTLDPATASGQQESRLLSFLYEGLTVPHPKTLEPLPGAAESWEISVDQKSYRFFLRENLRWSNGELITAADFVQSWKRLLDPQTGSNFAYLLRDVESFQAVDEREFRVQLKKALPYFLNLTYLWPLVPVHVRSLEEWKIKSPSRWRIDWMRTENLINNGPYRILERRINDRIRLEKNPQYWDREEIQIETIDVLALESPNTRLNLFLTGELDWTQQIPISVIPKLRNSPALRNESYLGTYLYYFNVNRPPLNDSRVRQALIQSIDRHALVKQFSQNVYFSADSLIPPRIENYKTAILASFNPEQAKLLLREAGFPNGENFPSLEILYNNQELHRDLAELIQDQWKRHLGIEIKLRAEEWKSFLDSQIRHDYSISRGSWIADYPDPMAYLEIFHSTSGNNRSGFSHLDFDTLLEKATNTLEASERFQLLTQAESVLLEQAPVLPLFFYAGTHLVNPALQGWESNALDLHFPKFWRLSKSPITR